MQRFPLAIALMVLILAACGQRAGEPFTERERTIIERSDSVMYVTTITADSAILRTPSRDLSPEEIRSLWFPILASKMLSTVRSPKQDGVGIAAPQVGLNVRAAAVQRFDLPGEPFIVYPNIKIDSLFGEITHGPEGCLSVPPMRGLVPRYSSVAVSWTDSETLQTERDTVHGYTAIIFQHECDHLAGTLYIDKADTVFVSGDWAAERTRFDYSRPEWWPAITEDNPNTNKEND